MMDNGVFWYFDRSGLEEVRGSGFQKVEGGCWDFVGEFFGVVSKVEWCVCDEQVGVTRSFYRFQ